MRKILANILPVLMLSIIVGSVHASYYDNTCTTAKAIGVGYSLTALADDPTAIYWNPANLSKGTGLSFTRTNPYQIPGYTVDNIAISKKVRNLFHLAMAYNAENAELISWSGVSGYNEKRMGIGIAVPVVNKLNLGLTSWKSTIKNGDLIEDDHSFDLAVSLDQNRLSFAVVVHNLASFNANPFSTIGVGYWGRKLRLGIDIAIDKLGEIQNNYSVGLEARIHENVMLRIGFNGRLTPSAIGLGLKKDNLNFDLAYKITEVGSFYTYSMGLGF